MQTVADLFEGIVEPSAFASHARQTVRGLFDDSRRVQPDGVFVAVRGSESDGRRYVDDAVTRGARVVVGEEMPPRRGVLVINVPDARTALARLAARWYGLDRGTGPKLIGITGTNGKSTTAHMTRAILRAAGMRCGMLGTVQYDLCSRSVKADLTTPGPLQLAACLRECADAGADAVIMEVSSHALDQRRVEGLRFAAAAFTNLTQDHLDYHGTMDAYGRAKARLFAGLGEDACAVINADDPHAGQMTADCRARVVTYGLDSSADLTACITRTTLGGTVYRLRTPRGNAVLENALVGRHNVYNALAAAGLAQALGVGLAAIESGLASVRTIPGRLQRVPGVQGFEVFVDYAHTPDALRNVAGVLRPLTPGRLIVVFGCGGDRDRGKRPQMAAAAAEFAHAIIVTSDNPRTEDPQRIIDDILAGFDAATRRRVVVEPDRRRAIFAAIGGARRGDVVLIAGKGHEDYQIIGRERVHFDDVQVAIEAAGERCGRDVGAA